MQGSFSDSYFNNIDFSGYFPLRLSKSNVDDQSDKRRVSFNITNKSLNEQQQIQQKLKRFSLNEDKKNKNITRRNRQQQQQPQDVNNSKHPISQLKRSNVKKYKSKSLKGNKVLEPAPTSNPFSTNDPTDMDADLPPLKIQVHPWLPGPPHPPKLIHASLIPLSKHKRHLSNHSNRHSRKISTHINMASRIILQTCNPRKPPSSILSSDTFRFSQINNNNELQQKNQDQERKQKRESIILPQGNRASQIFRRQLLEQSLLLSFGGAPITNNNIPVTTISHNNINLKPPRRRKTRKGSNAKLEDREARRERRRPKPSSSFHHLSPTIKVSVIDDKSSTNSSKLYPTSVNTTSPSSQFTTQTKTTPTEEFEKNTSLFNRQLKVDNIATPPASLRNSPTTPQFPLSPKSPTITPLSPTSPKPPLLSSSSLALPATNNRITSTAAHANNNNNNEADRLRKMQKFEAIIANSEMPTKKLKAATNTIQSDKNESVLSSPSSSSSNSVSQILESPSNRKAFVLANKVNKSIAPSETEHYNPEEVEKQGSICEDGVIRVTLTPATMILDDEDVSGKSKEWLRAQNASHGYLEETLSKNWTPDEFCKWYISNESFAEDKRRILDHIKKKDSICSSVAHDLRGSSPFRINERVQRLKNISTQLAEIEYIKTAQLRNHINAAVKVHNQIAEDFVAVVKNTEKEEISYVHNPSHEYKDNRGILQDSQYDVNQVESIYLKELALVEASKNPIYVKLLGVGNEIA
ncbi:12347_t:CDS:10 [Entrophospora sp. SA101]|nr:12347_t:CDS:10 [Entrophospora sp. SA101]